MTCLQHAFLEDHLRRMQHEIEVTTRRLELEKRRLTKLEEETRRSRQEYDEKVLPPKKRVDQITGRIPLTARSAMSASANSVANIQFARNDKALGLSARAPRNAVRDVKRFENRLAKSLSVLNTLKHGNLAMRNKMDKLRRERLQMNQVFKKLQEDVRECNGQIKMIEAEATTARQIKEEATEQISVLKKTINNERKEFREGVLGLTHDLEHTDRKRRDELVRFGRDARIRKNKNSNFLVAEEESEFSDTAFMKRIFKLAFLNAIQRRHIKQHQKNIEVFEQAFATIKSTTGISDIEEIVKIFVKLEERNFSLLTYVNQLNRDIETMDLRNRELGSQLDTIKESDFIAEKRRFDVLQDIKQQIQTTLAVTKSNTQECQKQEFIVQTCFPAAQDMLKMIEAEHSQILGTGKQSLPHSDNLLDWLTTMEQKLTTWKDFLPEPKEKTSVRPFPYTVCAQVKQLPPKRTQFGMPLLRTGDLPSTVDKEDIHRRRLKEEPDDSESDGDHVWTRSELKEKVLTSLAKRRKYKRVDMQAEKDDDADDKELGFDEIVEKRRDSSSASDASGSDDEFGPTDEEINEIFLKRYKMTREELQAMADKMGIHLNNLCYLKQEFDAYDEDRSGYIDVKELKELLHKLGEELEEKHLQEAFRELDQDGSGEIEFFEFVEWFTSED